MAKRWLKQRLVCHSRQRADATSLTSHSVTKCMYVGCLRSILCRTSARSRFEEVVRPAQFDEFLLAYISIHNLVALRRTSVVSAAAAAVAAAWPCHTASSRTASSIKTYNQIFVHVFVSYSPIFKFFTGSLCIKNVQYNERTLAQQRW